MQLNPAARELIFKVVYYGPGMAGKTTNLAGLQAKAPPGTASELVTVDTHSERTLHFDMLVADLGQIQGNNVRVEFHTVPGQSYYAATRRQLLVGADAVVFVADSRREALDENIASMNEMLDNLRQLGMPNQIPVVLQYNKQDLPTAVRPEQLDPLMNVRNWPSRGACAASGEGVEECAGDILRMLAEIAAQAQLPEVAVAAEPRSWLISCHRCQAMLEVPDAAVGSIYTCGVCSSALEVVDPDRGLTREPQPGRSPLALQPADLGRQQPPPQQQQQRIGASADPSDYAMKTLPTQQEASGGESALQRSQPQPQAPAAGGGAFPLAGWEVINFIDESPQGRRMRVRDQSSGRICRALVLSPALMAQPGYTSGIEPYVRLAGPLKHPHILPLLEMRPAGDTVVLLSADVPEHEPLGIVLGRRRALAPPHAMGILRQVVLALEDAARQGVVHGWLRPECILVSPDGTVLVDEFAVPKSHRFLVRELAGASAATEYYLAPEHLGEDARSDLRSDMFLCGALLYRMVTGDGLVTGYNAHEALHRLMAGGGKPLRAVGNSVSRDLDLFYRQLTALNRGERFESYRMLVEVLDRFGGGAKRQNLRLTQPIHAPPGARGPTTPAGGTPQRSGTAVHQRPGSGAHARTGTGAWRTPTGSIAGPRRTTENLRPAPPRRTGGGVVAIVVVIAILAMVGAVAYVVTQQRQQPPQPQPQAPAQEPRAPAAPAPPPARPATAASIGATPPEPPRPAPAAAAKPPDAPAEAPPAELTPGQRRDLLNRIADLVLEERFQQALAAAEQLPTAEDRQAQYQQVVRRRDARRQEIEARARTAPELATVQAAVRPALEGVWGMPGDREWARGVLDQTEARLAGAEPPAAPAPPAQPAEAAVPAAPAAPAPAAEAPPAAAPAAEPAQDQALAALAAIARGDLAGAQAAAAALPEAQPDGRATRLAVASVGQRTGLLDRVAKAQNAKLRTTHPTTRESVDLVSASATGIEVAAPGGAVSALSWGQVGARDLGRLLADAAAAPGARVEDHACAITGLIVGGDAVLAAVHLRKVRAQLQPEQAGDLEALVGIGKRADAQMLLARAADAVKAGSAKALAECLAELRKPERAALSNVAAALPRLESALKELQDGKTPGAARLADRVLFDSPADLASFPDSTGTWQVAAGTATNIDAARLARRDMAGARSVQLIITPSARRGSVAVEFRGLRLAFDLANGQFTTQVADKAGAAKPCTVVERVPNTLYLAYVEDGNHTTVELNGQVIADAVMGDLGEVFALGVAGGALVQVDEVVFTRAEAQNPARQALRRLGWEPLGNAALDEKAGAIALAGLPNAPAGISCQVPANTVGYTLDIKGQGSLRIQIGGTGGSQHADVPLAAAEATRYTVRWAAGTFVVLDGNGVPLNSTPLARPVVSVSFAVGGGAVIALPIRPNRQ